MSRTLRVAAAILSLAALAGVAPRAQPPSSTLIRGAMVVDGTGAPRRQADVRLSGSKIVEVGSLSPAAGERVVDAGGLTLAPGFIDTHSHHDRGLAEQRAALAAVSQGITTIVVGQDGGSSYPLTRFFEALEASPAALNVASYVGHGTLRRHVMGSDYRRASTEAELATMRELLRSEMQAGAFGLSTGLEYDPGIYSKPEEVIALAKDVAAMGGRYMSHIRSEDRYFWQAIQEVLTIGREARLPVHVSHIKLAMRSLWGQSEKLVSVLDKARAEGIQLTADIYPYTYWQSGVTVLFPKRDYTDAAEAKFVLDQVVPADGLLFTSYPPAPEYNGKTLAQIAAIRKTDPATTLLDLIKESEASERGASVVGTSMDERDVARLMGWAFANICSDGALDGGHPRGFGAFPRVLGGYVRERGALTLEDAIRKMTSLSAANAGITDRGTIAPGQVADLVLFDAKTVIDRATTADPHARSVGIKTVWVNGTPVFSEGSPSGDLPGRVLRRR